MVYYHQAKNHKNGSQDQAKSRKIDLLTLHHPQTGIFQILIVILKALIASKIMPKIKKNY